MAAVLLRRLSTKVSTANAFNHSRRFPIGAAAAVSSGIAFYYCYSSSPTLAYLDAQGEQTADKVALNPDKWLEFKLQDTAKVSHNTQLYRFSFDPAAKLGLDVASCIVTRAPIGEETEGRKKIPGESLEEAVRRETCEEAGIEVGEVVYHSSQPWPVGPNSMPCQLMVGFFAYAKSLEIRVDKSELEDAQWYSREDVKKALTFAEYEKAQRTSAFKVNQMCKGVEKGQNFSSDFNVESGELAPMFVPGPFAIAHHLISSWVHQTTSSSQEPLPKQLNSVSSL